MTNTGESGVAGQGETAGQPATPFGADMLMWMVVIFAVFIGLSLMSGRKEKRRRREMLKQLSKNSSVQTIGGIMGSVVEVKGDFVVLQVDESSKTRMTFSRAAIQQVLEPGEEAASN
ncbi:MAG: preprotein translocase subunit YajC [Phycisphaerales bacterium]|nr:preprotein translocase subunit YajC [Phycisphaerales bacterium]